MFIHFIDTMDIERWISVVHINQITFNKETSKMAIFTKDELVHYLKNDNHVEQIKIMMETINEFMHGDRLDPYDIMNIVNNNN